jgi:hypothetical protein
MKFRTMSVTLALFVSAAAVALSPGTAQALPSNCSFGPGNTSLEGWAQCTAGTGQFRAKVTCDMKLAIDVTKYGAWLNVTNPPSNSIAYCPLDARKGYNYGVERK